MNLLKVHGCAEAGDGSVWLNLVEGSSENKAETWPKERMVVGLERLSENLYSIL